MRFSCKCKSSSSFSILKPNSIKQMVKTFCFWCQWTLIDVWSCQGSLGIGYLISKSCCAFDPTPRKRGHSQGEHIRTAGATCPHILGLGLRSKGTSVHLGAECGRMLSAFLQPETMQMCLQIHLWPCWQFLSATPFVRWWYWYLLSFHCPDPNGVHCFLHNRVGTLCLTQRAALTLS